MSIYQDRERRFLTAIANLAHANPFLPERVEYEKAALGKRFIDGGAVWSASVENPDAESPNIIRMHALVVPLIESVRERLAHASDISAGDLTLYEECVLHLLYQRYYLRFVAGGPWRFYTDFAADWNHYFQIPG